MSNISKNTNIVDRSFNQIVDHIQYSIDTLPKILAVTDMCKRLELSIENFTYSPTVEYISLALKLDRELTEYDCEMFVLLASKQFAKIILMSKNQLIIKYSKYSKS